MKNLIREIAKRMHSFETAIWNDNRHNMEAVKILIGGIRALENSKQEFKQLRDYEFKVFSQWGEDGIIQQLIRTVDIPNKVFVEFGVEDYRESNTRFLLMNDNWSGLIIDGSERNMNAVRNSDLYWRYDLQAVSAFITRENINSLIQNAGISGDIGILSVDIDGNDYWVWEAIDCIRPRIVICEYNSLFGKDKEISTPYKADFVRGKYHHSNIVYGASIKALCSLGKMKGYKFVGSNSAGNNLFFVIAEGNEAIREASVEEEYVQAKFREERDENGALTFHSFQKRKENVRNAEVYDLERQMLVRVGDL